MNLYFRLIIALLSSLSKKSISPLEKTQRELRVWPWDLDILGHMNNGRYLQIMDVARVDWMKRSGILKIILKNRWGALLGGTMIRHQGCTEAF